ncbi:MAG: S-adenosylmethionine decarboxylase, partial [Blastocatellia bacterium]
TYPESGIATFNLYCCRLRPNWDWSAKLIALLGADRVTIRSSIRGAAAQALATSSAEVSLP